jgi:hypothetical protein
MLNVDQPAIDPVMPFDLKVFTRMLGFHPWRYSADTYHDGHGHLLDWAKGERLLHLPHSECLLSAYDGEAQRNVLYPYPVPQTLGEAFDIITGLGWLEGC